MRLCDIDFMYMLDDILRYAYNVFLFDYLGWIGPYGYINEELMDSFCKNY